MTRVLVQIVLTVLYALPLVLWLQPPWMGTLGISMCISMLVAIWMHLVDPGK